MTTPHLFTPHRLSVVLMLAVVGVCAPSARAALGGENGVVIPYAGKLELDGALVTGTVDFQFGVAPDASTAAPTTPVNCVFPLPDVPVTNGEFAVSIVIPAARESCVKGKDVHLEVRVARADETLVFLGKQRVTPVVSAATSGVGDFAVTGVLSAGTTTVAALTATSAAINGNVNVNSGNVQVNNGTVKVLSSDNTSATNIAEFKSFNQASGVGIGFNTVRATGSNVNENLNLEGKGTGVVRVNDDLQINGRQTITGASSTTVIAQQATPSVTSGAIAAGDFVSRGGRHLIVCSLTSFTLTSVREMSVRIDDKELDAPGGPVTKLRNMTMFANSARVHIPFPTAVFVATLSAGRHVISVSIDNVDTRTDDNDTIELTVIELP
jgi:hypothetical protein